MEKGSVIYASYLALNTTTNEGVSGDVANHSIRILRDGVLHIPVNTPTEVSSVYAKGIYSLILNSSESNSNMIRIVGKSTTANVVIIAQEIFLSPAISSTIHLLRQWVDWLRSRK